MAPTRASRCSRELETAYQALGLDQIHLLGVGYGIRLAQTYAGLYPERRSRSASGVTSNRLLRWSSALWPSFTGARVGTRSLGPSR
jgi:pimeloyl-ACP methyl ester carboxylesterase